MGTMVQAQRGSSSRLRLPDGTRSVQSPWVWRGILFMSLVAGGFAVVFLTGHQYLYSAGWGLIAAGWFAISMWLWRKHVRDDDAAWAARQKSGRPV